jgi:diguanylate cyclase (GGDEF)-like protein/PAS domain S-box-containing protein
MASSPRLDASFGTQTLPLDVRDPDVVAALVDAIAIIDAAFRPRITLGRLGPPGSPLPGTGEWIHPDDCAAIAAGLRQCAATPGTDVELPARIRAAADGWHHTTIVLRNLLDHPDVQGIVVRAIDHTVVEHEARWRTLVGDSPIGIFELDHDDRCVFANESFARITGMDAADALGTGWYHMLDLDDLATMRARRQHDTAQGGASVCELRIAGAEDHAGWVELRSVPIRDDAGNVTGWLGTLEDLTDRKQLEARLEYDATHDRLTGLGSRALLVAEAKTVLGRSRRVARGVALLFIDLDGFKRVNDMLGHAAGDELLIQVARRLEESTRDSDLCVRLGGDEFVACCPDVDSLEVAEKVAERLLARISAPYDIHGHEVRITASIGISHAQGDDPVSVDQLLSNADIAAYRAKNAGRARIEVFDDELRRELARHRKIARSVGRLLDQMRVPLQLTPIAELTHNTVVGFDCSVDWERAEFREPLAVITQIVEETGMSRALDLAVVRTMLAQLSEWDHDAPAESIPGLGVRLTAAGAQSPLLPELVRDMIARTRAEPARCWVGIPEAAVAHDLEATSQVASALEDLGIGVALRDFGSAVSSLEQLRQLPAPTVTIAGPLVEAVAVNDETDREAGTALLAAIVQYAQALGRVVVAFGVRDLAHAERLRALGFDFGSGPAFGPCMAPDQVRDFLTAP